ncbi:MAG: hydrolase [Oleiphilus sp.]|nr:MAG: hydrolase [Oleiphilus sp.]
MLEQNNCGLIVVDVQGKLARLMHQSAQFIAQTSKLIQGCRQLGMPVIYLEHCVDKLGPTVPELKEQLEGIAAINKTSFGACGTEAFNAAVRASGKGQWLVSGIEAHVCVYQTALGLSAQHYQVEVVADCISSREADNIDLALGKLNRTGIEITTLEMCLFELMRDAGHPQFKDIVRLFR